jgi:hypothetical protein
MSDQSTQTETTETVSPKLSVADRKALASAAFVPDADPTEVAALFGNVPNGREYLDVVYSSNVTRETMGAIESGNAANLAEVLAPYATLRETVEKAMTAAGVSSKSAREVDPIAARAALVNRLAELTAIADHLVTSAQWVTDLADAIDPGDLTDDEKATVAAATVADDSAVAKLTTRIAAAVEKTPRATSGDGTRERATVAHADYPVGTTLTAKGDPSKVATVIAGADGKVAYQVGSDTFKSISSAAKALAGGERNGWTYFEVV